MELSDFVSIDAREGNPRGTKMKRLMIMSAALAITASAALAQSQNPPAQSGPDNPAVNTTGTNNSNDPVAGANSFTEGQAKSQYRGKRLHATCPSSRRTTTASGAARR